MQSSQPDKPVLQTKNVGVSFSGIAVLRNITVGFQAGSIHGLIGENGAGKSTLGKVIGGYYAASSGDIELHGSCMRHWDPPTALAHGVAIMHQELQLVPALTVAQNVFLGLEEHRLGVLKKTESARLSQLMLSSGFVLEPEAVVSDLSIADQQKIEILRALARNAKIIVMDEPTSSLSKDEVDQLHQSMCALRHDGHTIIYVSHFLDDILGVTDRVTVLRDGEHVKTSDTAHEDKSSLVAAMLGGGKSETVFPGKRFPVVHETVLEVNHISNDSGVTDASLTIAKGEIVGLLGLVGSGRSEIARAIVGADQANTGEVTLNGSRYANRSVSQSTDRSLVMVPEDRRKQGLVMTLPVRANMTLPHLSVFSCFSFLRNSAEKKRARELIDYFQVKPADIDGNVFNYSGGNQQKLLLGKWLIEKPSVVILDEPSRGVDVGARERIHQAIAELAHSGTAVLLISSEIEEVLGLAHRAYLVDRGTIVDEIDVKTNDEASVLNALFRYQSVDVGEQEATGTQTRGSVS